MILEQTKLWELLFAKLALCTALPVTLLAQGRVPVALTAPFVVAAQSGCRYGVCAPCSIWGLEVQGQAEVTLVCSTHIEKDQLWGKSVPKTGRKAWSWWVTSQYVTWAGSQ